MKKTSVTKIDNNKKSKTGYGLKQVFGILKDDKEYDITQKEIKQHWHKWTKKYIK